MAKKKSVWGKWLQRVQVLHVVLPCVASWQCGRWSARVHQPRALVPPKAGAHSDAARLPRHAAALRRQQTAAACHMMVYDWRSTRVLAVFGPGAPELAAWCLQDPAGLQPPPGCDWERCALPEELSAPTRAARARDPQGWLRGAAPRLAEALPAGCQEWQSSPYLDPDLYRCWERLAGAGSARPHCLPRRALKWLARCQPERLRFRLDPEHLLTEEQEQGQRAIPVAMQGGAAAGGGSGCGSLSAGGGWAAAAPAGGAGQQARRGREREREQRDMEVRYLFHPSQPLLLAVVQDASTSIALRLSLYTRL